MNFGDAFADNKVLQASPVVSPVIISPIATAGLPATIPANLERKFTEIMATNMNDISGIGSKCGEEFSKLSAEITSKVTAANAGELGAGIKNVLALTQGVNLAKYGEQNKGFFGKLKAKFTSAQLDFKSQFDSTADQIQTVLTSLAVGLDRMKDDADWLSRAYDANIKHHNELQETAEAMNLAIETLRTQVQNLAAQPDVDVNVLQGQQMYLDRMEKHHDKLLRLIQLAKLTAPEIRQMQMTNYNTVQTFNDLRDITVPAWAKTISLGLLSLQQKKDAEFADTVQNAANENLMKASDLINANMVQAAQINNRSVIDMSTLEHVQTNMLNTLKTVQGIESKAAEDRKQGAVRIKQMEQELRTELLALSKK